MAESESVLKLNLSGDKKRFDARTDRHYHLKCEDCGCVCDIELSELKEIEKRLVSLKGSEGILDFTLYFKGKCKKCEKQYKKKGS